MIDELSQVELNEIERKIRSRRTDENVTINANLLWRLYDMATRPTADENTERLERELDEMRMRVVTAEVECELIRKERDDARERCRVMEIDHRAELKAVQTGGHP